ncbi:hypothetical protein [Paenibacillus polymyxa]|uniref:hypothetical protein n=1 Tax=Paenibacillus polymyxa TaxID=1406 RepID=UPI000B194824|nr:hypothetical protein [Paenibacillus polymyxa]MBY7736008.1 hypothetical protein [Paenibacillus polymyxa]
MKNEHLRNSTIFTVGSKKKNFIANAFLQLVFNNPVSLNKAIGSVTFASDARNN